MPISQLISSSCLTTKLSLKCSSDNIKEYHKSYGHIFYGESRFLAPVYRPASSTQCQIRGNFVPVHVGRQLGSLGDCAVSDRDHAETL